MTITVASDQNGKRGKGEHQNSVFLAMVALSGPVVPDVRTLKARLRSLWSDGPRFEELKVDGEVISFEIGPAVGGIGLIRAPIPEGDLQAACEVSLEWPEAAERLKEHRAHLICTVSGPVEKKTAAYFLTKLVAALCVEVPAVGVYWGAATLVHDPVVFASQASEMSLEILPLYLWIRFAVAAQGDTATLRTVGMRSLGFMELEIVGSSRSAEEIVGFAFNVCHYLLDNGPVLGDGQTIGMSAEEKVPVRHTASFLDPDEKVYRLAY